MLSTLTDSWQFQELNRLITALGEIMKTETIGSWLLKPNAAFDGLKRIEVIDCGEIDRLWSIIYSTFNRVRRVEGGLKSANPN